MSLPVFLAKLSFIVLKLDGVYAEKYRPFIAASCAFRWLEAWDS